MMARSDTTPRAQNPRRVVLKLGTALITSNGLQFDREAVGAIAESVARLMERGIEVVLVSSGAVGAGMYRTEWDRETTSIIDRQALAAVGQPFLMNAYADLFAEHGIKVAQILLTRTGLEDRQRYLNARHTLDRLLSLSILPIVNENDTVVTEELQFGDNDRLAAVVAGKIHSDLLILLTDVDAVWDENKDPVKRVSKISAALLKAAKGPSGERSRGGMKSKLVAVQEAMSMGVTAVIGSGREPGIVDRIVESYARMSDLSKDPDPDAEGSWFISTGTGLAGRKRWILSCGGTKGTIYVDPGAKKALEVGGRSLLPSGVFRVDGEFLSGDPVTIATSEEDVVGQGLANLSSAELTRFKGRSSREIKEEIHRPVNSCVAVHRDDLVLLRDAETEA